MESKRVDEALIELCRSFNKHYVKYIVVGGFAVIMHGLARMTEDIDLFVEDSIENMEKIKEALMDLYRGDNSVNDLKSTDLKDYAVIRYGTPDNFYIDFIGRLGEAISFEDVSKDSELFEIDDLEIPVCSLEMLIKMKETVRERNGRDLRFLKAKRDLLKRGIGS